MLGTLLTIECGPVARLTRKIFLKQIKKCSVSISEIVNCDISYEGEGDFGYFEIIGQDSCYTGWSGRASCRQ